MTSFKEADLVISVAHDVTITRQPSCIEAARVTEGQSILIG